MGTYELTLSTSIGRAIAFELMEIVAMNPVFFVKRLFYLPPDGNPDSADLDNIRVHTPSHAEDGEDEGMQSTHYGDWIPHEMDIYEEPIEDLGELELNLITDLKIRAGLADDFNHVEQLFKRNVSRGILNQLNPTEFMEFLNELGYKISLRDTLAMIRSLDNDEKDLISYEEIKEVLLDISVPNHLLVSDIFLLVRVSSE